MLLGLAVGAGQGVTYRTVLPPAPSKGSPRTPLGHLSGAPQTPEKIARMQRGLAEAFRYKGTTAVAGADLDPDDARVKKVCEMLSRADIVPELRVRCFSDLDPSLTVVGWHLTVERLDVRRNDSLVRVRVTPLLRTPDSRAMSVLSVFHEDYRIAGGKVDFMAAEPLELDQAIKALVQ